MSDTLDLDAIEARFGAEIRARREHDPAVQDVLALTAEVRRLQDEWAQAVTDMDGFRGAMFAARAERDRLRAAIGHVKELADCYETYEGLLSGQTVATTMRRTLGSAEERGELRPVSTKQDGSDLRDRLVDALAEVQPRFVISNDGVKVVAEDTIDALLPVIRQHIREIPDKPWRDLDHLAQLIGLRI